LQLRRLRPPPHPLGGTVLRSLPVLVARAFTGVLVLVAAPRLSGQSPVAGGHDTSSAPAQPSVTARGPALADSAVTAALKLGQARKNKRTYGYLGAANCTKFGEFVVSDNAMR